MLVMKAPIAASTSASKRVLIGHFSPVCVSKELKFTSHTRVGTLALISVDTMRELSLKRRARR